MDAERLPVAIDAGAKRAEDRLRRDVVWNLVPVALLAVVGLGLNFAIAGCWGSAALGVFTLVTTVYFAFAVVGACGLQYSVLRAVAEDADDRDRVAAVVVGALVPAAGLAALATAVFVAIRAPIGHWLGRDAVAEGMLWAAPGLFCFAINKVLLCVVNGLRRMRAFATYTSLRYLLIAAGLLLARAAHLAPAHLAAIWTFTEGVLLIVLAVELLATVALRRGTGWMVWARRHVEFGVHGVAATLASEINSKLDVWMLGVLTTDTALVGVYALAGALNEGMVQVAGVMQTNLNPIAARLLAHGQVTELEALVRSTRRWVVPALIAICVVAAAAYPLVIPWVTGDHEFAAGAVPFAILMAGIAIASPYLPFMQLLLMAKRPGWHTALMVGTLAINVAGNRMLIPILGLEGAALSTAFTVVVSMLVLRGLVRSRAGVRL